MKAFKLRTTIWHIQAFSLCSRIVLLEISIFLQQTQPRLDGFVQGKGFLCFLFLLFISFCFFSQDSVLRCFPHSTASHPQSNRLNCRMSRVERLCFDVLCACWWSELRFVNRVRRCGPLPKQYLIGHVLRSGNDNTEPVTTQLRCHWYSNFYLYFCFRLLSPLWYFIILFSCSDWCESTHAITC
jgi:hypothetical protein